tara:strand:- start:185 stop:490 length:306 start_codon:yes stop_codon:yes gene_type:complete
MNIPFLIRNLPIEKRDKYYILKYKNEIKKIKNQNYILNQDIKFYKSIFKNHFNSVVYNLRIKYKNGERVWIDKLKFNPYEYNDYDEDEELKEWTKPIKCER